MKKMILSLFAFSTLVFGKVDKVTLDKYEEVSDIKPVVASITKFMGSVAEKYNLDPEYIESMELDRETIVYLPIDYGFVVACIVDRDSTLIFQADGVFLPDLMQDEEFNRLYKEHIKN